jgi:hypothetical protein
LFFSPLWYQHRNCKTLRILFSSRNTRAEDQQGFHQIRTCMGLGGCLLLITRDLNLLNFFRSKNCRFRYNPQRTQNTSSFSWKNQQIYKWLVEFLFIFSNVFENHAYVPEWVLSCFWELPLWTQKKLPW